MKGATKGRSAANCQCGNADRFIGGIGQNDWASKLGNITPGYIISGNGGEPGKCYDTITCGGGGGGGISIVEELSDEEEEKPIPRLQEGYPGIGYGAGGGGYSHFHLGAPSLIFYELERNKRPIYRSQIEK